MYEFENWDEDLIELFSLYLKLKQEHNQFQHMIEVSIKKVKTEEMFIKILEKLEEFYKLLFEFLEKLWKYQGEDVSILPLEQKIEIFSDEFLGYEFVFNYYFKLKRALEKIRKKDYKIIHEFKKDIAVVFEDENNEQIINIKELRELDRKILDLFDSFEKN
jgi:hypothetical protein